MDKRKKNPTCKIILAWILKHTQAIKSTWLIIHVWMTTPRWVISSIQIMVSTRTMTHTWVKIPT